MPIYEEIIFFEPICRLYVLFTQRKSHLVSQYWHFWYTAFTLYILL